MTEEIINTPDVEIEVSDDDKLWAMLGWIPWLGVVLAIIALLIEPQKDSPFIRFHAVQSIAVNIIIAFASVIFIWTACLPFIFGLLTIYPAIKAYQGEWFEFPYLTQFCKDQGWI